MWTALTWQNAVQGFVKFSLNEFFHLSGVYFWTSQEVHAEPKLELILFIWMTILISSFTFQTYWKMLVEILKSPTIKLQIVTEAFRRRHQGKLQLHFIRVCSVICTVVTPPSFSIIKCSFAAINGYSIDAIRPEWAIYRHFGVHLKISKQHYDYYNCRKWFYKTLQRKRLVLWS